MLMRFKDSSERCKPGMVPPGAEDRVMQYELPYGRYHGAGFRRPMPGAVGLPGLFAGVHGVEADFNRIDRLRTPVRVT